MILILAREFCLVLLPQRLSQCGAEYGTMKKDEIGGKIRVRCTEGLACLNGGSGWKLDRGEDRGHHMFGIGYDCLKPLDCAEESILIPSPANVEAATMFKENIKEYERRVKVSSSLSLDPRLVIKC